MIVVAFLKSLSAGNARSRAVDLTSVPSGASDYRMVAWSFHAVPTDTPIYRTQHRTSWRLYIDQFKADLMASCLSSPSMGNASSMTQRYDEVITALLDCHAPTAEITCTVKRSSDMWCDSESRSAKRHASWLEPRFKRWRRFKRLRSRSTGEITAVISRATGRSRTCRPYPSSLSGSLAYRAD